MVNTSFCALSCQYVRLGNYQAVPRGKVLTTDKFIQMKVPRLENPNDFVTLDIGMEEVLNVLVHLGDMMPVLFVYLSPKGCKLIRDILKMRSRHSYFLDIHGCQDETQKRVTILLNKITLEEERCLKTQFGSRLHEVKFQNAYNIHLQSSPKNQTFTNENNNIAFVLTVKKSLKTGLLLIKWHRSSEGTHIKISKFSLQVSVNVQNRKSWKTFIKGKFSSKIHLPHTAKYDGNDSEVLHFRVKIKDKNRLHHYSNVASYQALTSQ